jgi:Transposase, Mutator family
MEVELTGHLGYEPHLEPPGGVGNARNGTTPKTLITEHGPVQVDTPRDRNGSFEPQIVRKRQRRPGRFPRAMFAACHTRTAPSRSDAAITRRSIPQRERCRRGDSWRQTYRPKLEGAA